MSGLGGVTPRIIAIKTATREAVEAAGGLEFCETQTKAGRSQLSRGCSRNHDDTVTVRDAVVLDNLTMGRGGPFIVREMARQLGCVVIVLPDVGADETGIARALMGVAAEMGDVAREADAALRDGLFTHGEAVRVGRQIDELIEHAAGFRALVSSYEQEGETDK